MMPKGIYPLNHPDKWTDKKVELLRNLWGLGHSASKIAFALGEEFTRNSVIGKAHRLGLDKRNDPIKRDEESRARGLAERKRRQEAKERAAYERAKRKAAKIIPFIPPKPAYIAPQRLSNSQCRWPNGDPKKPGFHFCQERAIQGKPYCPEHDWRAHRQPTPAEEIKLRAAE